MKIATMTTAALACALAMPMLAQDGAKQDLKNAGHATKEAAKDTGSAVKKGTVKGAKATKHGTAVGATKTARGTKSVAKKATGDKSPTTTPHDPPK